MENITGQDDQSVERYNELLTEKMKSWLLEKDPTLDWGKLQVEPNSIHRFVGIGSDDAETRQKLKAAFDAMSAENGQKGECNRE